MPYTATTYGGAPNWSFEYDPNGNLSRSVDPVGPDTTSFVYDVENRLVSASGANNAALVYDPLGRLVQVTAANGARTQFLYHADRMIAEYDGSGNLLKRYVHGPGADEPVAVYEGPGLGLANRRYTMPDERGSVMALVDSDGTPAVKNRYDPWGVPGAANEGRFQYTGQAWIAELGLYHYKARFYSPRLGRFMQTDPIGYEDQINLYAYVGNDPVNNTDPDGKCFESCPASYTSLGHSERVRQGDRIASEMVVTALYEGSGIGSVVAAINNPNAANVIMAAVGASPAGRVTGPIYQAARGAQQVARRLGMSPVARATSDGRGIRFGARPGRPEAVRVMRGNPNSPNPAQRDPYVSVRDTQGRSYNADGRVIGATKEFPDPAKNPEAHIPIDRFNPNKFRF